MGFYFYFYLFFSLALTHPPVRNTYTLLDFGDFVDTSSNDRGDPYVQLLPVTNAAAAKADFISVRLNGVDTTNDPSKALLPASEMQHSPESAAEKKEHYEAEILSRWPYILVGCLVLVGILVVFCIWRCCCRRKRGRSNRESVGAAFTGSPYYTPLQERR